MQQHITLRLERRNIGSSRSTHQGSSSLLRRLVLTTGVTIATVVTLSISACQESVAPVARVTIGLNRSSVPLGGPLDLNIRFDMVPDTKDLTEDYRVLIHFIDDNDELLWIEDHDPPQPTSNWIPGQTITYRQRITIPMYPYTGTASVAIGLYSPTDGTRLPLAGDNIGQRSYRAATLIIEPQPESSFLIYDDGWHSAEFSPDGRTTWRWTTARSTLVFRNPRTDVSLALELEGRPDLFEAPQEVTLVIDGRTLQQFTLDKSEPVFIETEFHSADLGTAETVRLELHVDKIFVPAEQEGNQNDKRELGARLWYAFLETH